MRAALGAHLYERALNILRYQGAPALLWHTLARLLSPLGTVGIATLYELDLTRPLVEARARVEVTIREATESDFEQVAELADGQGTASRELRERVRRGSRCFVAKIGDEVVHYNWLAFGWADVLPIAPAGRFIVLNDDEAFCMDAYTVARWRGRAIHTAVLHAMLGWLRATGIRTAYTVVSNENRPSWKTHERLGWIVRGTLVYLRPRRMDRPAWIWRTRRIARRFVARRREGA